MSESYNDVLMSLIGRQMTAVAFVMDYIRFEFEDAFLTALSLPSVQSDGIKLTYGMPGYRDMLCERITKIVTEASDTEKSEISIKFDDDSAISISLKPNEYRGAEAAMFQIPSQTLCVWRPE